MNAFSFRVQTSPLPGTLLCELFGSLDMSTAGELEPLARQQIQSGSEVVIFDLAGLEYINSQGLRAMLALHKSLDSASGGLILISPTERVKKILEVTGLHFAIPSYTNLDEALLKDPLLRDREIRKPPQAG